MTNVFSRAASMSARVPLVVVKMTVLPFTASCVYDDGELSSRSR